MSSNYFLSWKVAIFQTLDDLFEALAQKNFEAKVRLSTFQPLLHSKELLESGEDRHVCELTTRRLGDAEIDHLRARCAVVGRDQDIRRLDVAMDHSFLMCMLYGMTNL